MCETCSKLTIKIQERRQPKCDLNKVANFGRGRSGVLFLNIFHISF